VNRDGFWAVSSDDVGAHSVLTVWQRCADCGAEGPREIQFRYGDTGRAPYRVGEPLSPGDEPGNPEAFMVIVAAALTECPRCNKDASFAEVFIREGVIVGWERSTGRFDYPDVNTDYLEVIPRHRGPAPMPEDDRQGQSTRAAARHDDGGHRPGRASLPGSVEDLANRAPSFDWADYRASSPRTISEWIVVSDTAMVTVIDAIAVSEVNGRAFKSRHRNEAISHVSALMCEGCGIVRFILGTLRSPAHYSKEDADIRSNARSLVRKQSEYDAAEISAALAGPALEALGTLARKDGVARKTMGQEEATLWQLDLLMGGIRLALAEEDLFGLRT